MGNDLILSLTMDHSANTTATLLNDHAIQTTFSPTHFLLE